MTADETYEEFMHRLGAPIFAVDLDTHTVVRSREPHTVLAFFVADRGRSLYIARDFGSDLRCVLDDGFDPRGIEAGCTRGGAGASMSARPLSSSQCRALGRSSECYLIPLVEDFSVVGAPFETFDSTQVVAEGVGGARPVFWGTAPVGENSERMIVVSGRLGGNRDHTFGRNTRLRNTCFSRYRAAFDERPPRMRLETYVCTRTETLTSTNNLIAVACPPDSDATSCFVGMNLAFSPNECVLYWVEAR